MKDVCIDTAGVFAGILIILAMVSIYIALKNDNKKQKTSYDIDKMLDDKERKQK